MPQQYKIGRVATSVARDEKGVLRVTYHGTVVVKVAKNGDVTLDHGGWKTATTKTRMNQASNQLSLGFHVYQEAGRWRVHLRASGRDIPFHESPLLIRARQLREFRKMPTEKEVSDVRSARQNDLDAALAAVRELRAALSHGFHASSCPCRGCSKRARALFATAGIVEE